MVTRIYRGIGAVAATALILVAANSAPAAPAPMGTVATLSPSLVPNRPGAKAALTIAIRYAGGAFGVPAPVRKSVLRLPAGLNLEMPSLRFCRMSPLRAHGVKACPWRSQLGSGHMLAETRAGSQVIAEDVALHAFLGLPHNLQPTFEILAQGYTPLERRVVLSGSVLADNAPYGERLVLSIPPVATLPLEPDASIVALSLTVGGDGHRQGKDRAAVLVPSRCPAGGFPFEGEFTYADGTSGSAVANIPCPRSQAKPSGRAARTIALNETSNLHLTSKRNFTLNEDGTASGTATGRIYVHLTAVSSDRVTVEVNIYPHGGSISGHGTGDFRRVGSTADFSGSMSIDRGTGRYAHIHGSGLTFGGTIYESRHDAIAVHVSGRVSD